MANGSTLIAFGALHNEPPLSSFATLDLRGQHPVLDFDDLIDEAAVFSAVMPQHYHGGGVIVYLHYSMTTATAGDIGWNIAFERIGDQQQNLDSEGFAPANSVNGVSVPSSSGLVSVVSVVFAHGADMDFVGAGEKFRVRIMRSASSDSAIGDAELHAVEIRES
ncbi:MAG: hypothetical protein ACE363_12310 [Alphaproteobacteria bacterium]